MFSFTSRPLQREITSLWYPPDVRLGRSYRRFGRFLGEKNLVPLPEIEERSLDCPDPGLPVPTELSPFLWYSEKLKNQHRFSVSSSVDMLSSIQND
jgi:hypothetical protein